MPVLSLSGPVLPSLAVERGTAGSQLEQALKQRPPDPIVALLVLTATTPVGAYVGSFPQSLTLLPVPIDPSPRVSQVIEQQGAGKWVLWICTVGFQESLETPLLGSHHCPSLSSRVVTVVVHSPLNKMLILERVIKLEKVEVGFVSLFSWGEANLFPDMPPQESSCFFYKGAGHFYDRKNRFQCC